MASGSMGRVDQNGFDFSSDDDNRHESNGVITTDLSIGVNNKDVNTTQMSMSKSSKLLSASFSPLEESCLNHDIINAVENTMKKTTDNMMRFLEGISSRLSQLELYCYNIDKSVGQMRSNFDRDHDETDLKLKSVQKHIQEVHRSVQILRDKQELAETEKELVKLQVVQMKSSPASSVQQDEDNHYTDMNGQQLAIAPQSPLTSRPVEQPLQPSLGPAPPMQTQGYYLSPPQMTTVLVSNQPLNGQYMTSNSPYHASQMQQPQSQGNQTSQHQSTSAYPQQWSQKVSSPSAYPSYLPNSAPMQPQYLATSAHANPQQVMATQHHPKTTDGYTLAPVNTYIIYDGEGGRMHHPTMSSSHLSQGGFSQVMMPPGTGPMIRPPQFVRNHPYNELIDKLANMGYRGEHVLGAIQRLEESGQPVDFNAVIDRLSGNSSGSSQRGWSG